jgi:chromosomal replication initiation ATPase DnaA
MTTLPTSVSPRLAELYRLLAEVHREIAREKQAMDREATLRSRIRSHRSGNHVHTFDAETASLVRDLANRLNTTVADMTGKSQVKHVAHLRAIICWVLRQHGRSYHDIGRALSRHHSSAIHAVRRVEATPDTLVHAQMLFEATVNPATLRAV